MHYAHADLAWVPIDATYHEARVVLKKGDSAWNPASTKPERVIWGPATVTYERSPSQIVAYVED